MPSESPARLKLEDPDDAALDAGDPTRYPRPPRMLVALAERQFEALRAEITHLKASNEDLTASSEKDRADVESLRKYNAELSRAWNVTQRETREKSALLDSIKQAHMELQAQMDALQASTAKDREALKVEREVLTTERGIFETHRSNFEVERDTSQKAILDDRKSIADHLHRMIQIIQPKTFPPTPELVVRLSARPLDPTASESTIPCRRPTECDTARTNARSLTPSGPPAHRGRDFPLTPGSWGPPNTPPSAQAPTVPRDPRRR
ncbi:hypothetical protein B0H17DRAFT_1220115 [Mycena rosella]|uniref:Uncharacterized protein n=1 Tax=Mycena rosella TaxID=1033263 RepID=A0AAD7BC61_MYCRO|nr:hypothetical protein B0H17DRAFT_1220115 [Mycena rosella]